MKYQQQQDRFILIFGGLAFVHVLFAQSILLLKLGYSWLTIVSSWLVFLAVTVIVLYLMFRFLPNSAVRRVFQRGNRD